MTENQQDAVLREKTAFRYTSAVERGDFQTAAVILAQAEDDPLLEQMILEINSALADELPPAPKVSSHHSAALPLRGWPRIQAALRALAPGVGLSALVLLLVFVVLALIGPAIGNTFENVSSNLGSRPLAERQMVQPTHAPAPTTAYGLPAAPAPTATPYYTAAQASGHGAVSGYPAPQEPAIQFPTTAAAQPTATPFLMGSAVPGSTPTTAPAAAPAVAVPTNQPRMVVRNAYLALTVANTSKTRDTVNEIISGYAGEGAYIVSSTERAVPESDQPVISMQLRVPVARYDTVVNRLVGIALHVDSRQEQAQDVTAEYVDTQARIKELQTAIDRLLEIESQAKTTQDLLTIEKALSDRRAELEAMEGRAQYFSGTAALSLIQLDLQPKIVLPTPTPTPFPTPQTWRPQDTAHSSVLVLLDDLRRFGDWLIVFGITTLPWLAVVGLIGYGGFRLLRRRRRP